MPKFFLAIFAATAFLASGFAPANAEGEGQCFPDGRYDFARTAAVPAVRTTGTITTPRRDVYTVLPRARVETTRGFDASQALDIRLRSRGESSN